MTRVTDVVWTINCSDYVGDGHDRKHEERSNHGTHVFLGGEYTFSFVCPFVLSFSVFDSCIAFFAFTFASLCSLVPGSGFCYSVILLFRLGATPPPRSLRAWSMRIPLACCLLSSFFLALLMLTCLFFFPSLSFSISIWTSFVFILSFSRGYYAVSSVSVSTATRLAYDVCIYIYNI